MSRPIKLHKVTEHNLKNVSLELPANELIVLSGVSGSGKSSLAFDTLYSEGQRRYVESLSAFARRRLGTVHKPQVESAENLTPTIAIEQKTVSRNPRSTVGTITEVYDFLRVIFARVATPCCPVTGNSLARQSKEAIFQQIWSEWKGRKAILLAPFAKGKKGEFQEQFEHLVKKGYLRARVDGTIRDLDEEILLDKNKAHDIDIVIDRLAIKEEEKNRLKESIETALTEGQGLFSLLDPENQEETLFSTEGFSQATGTSYPPLEPTDFSFNSPSGMCERCRGLGRLREFDLTKIIDPEKSIKEDCCVIASSYETVRYGNIYNNLANLYDFNVKTPWKKLSEEARHIFLFGNDQKWTRMQFVHPDSRKKWIEFVSWKGVISEALERYQNATSDSYKEHFEKLMTKGICSSCQGSRLKAYPSAARLAGHTIHQLSSLSIEDLKTFFTNLTLDEEKRFIAEEPLKEIHKRLSYLLDVGLGYLSLERDSPSLSGGEAQRVRLAALIGTGLVGVTYILDEPTIGLHPRDNNRLINTLLALRDLGNTVVVVEHDEEMIASADHVIDIGPEAGAKGGHVLYEGTPQKFKNTKNSLTADYLFGKKKAFKGANPRRTPTSHLKITGCTENNLKNIDVTVPLGCFVAITGVSGSGKSSLISETLFPALSNKLNHSELQVGAHKTVEGLENLDKVILIDQSPIGRIPRSNPATYIKLFDLIRDLYSELPASKIRGFTPGRFSFNVKEGCCTACEGMGMIRVDMDFLEEQWITCEQCSGKRFDEETLAIRYKGESIADVLQMTIDEAATFFKDLPTISKRLSLLQKVGLGYMRLGQPSTTISGGEAQRVKLARELVRPATGKTLYILDEPTTGLHFKDIDLLLKVLHELVDRGNSAVIIEHNMDLVRSADWIIDLGPEGGSKGGYLLGSGTPEELSGLSCATAQALLQNPDKKQQRTKVKPQTHIEVVGASENTLKSVSASLPRGAITVCTGPSGSGKSSFAFDTLYAEGQRRYSESLSPYARQFVTPCKKPKVDLITGLSPAVAIEQKASSGNPRSTVGTLTEIYDFLRVLWAKIGEAHCPLTKEPIRAISKESIADKLLVLYPGQIVTILAPLKAPQSLSAFQALIEQATREGIRRLYLNGDIHEIDSEITYDPKRKNQLMLVADRVKADALSRARLLESLESAAKLGQNTLYTLADKTLTFYNLSFSSSKRSYPPITPHTFSFNSKEGMCPECEGLGCKTCHGERLNPLARYVLVKGLSLGTFCRLPIEEALAFIENLPLSAEESVILADVIAQIKSRFTFLIDVGLSYLSLDRTAPTLSNGEAQRIRLARQLGSGLTNVLYVLDEPTIGLHEKDIQKLNQALIKLKELGNTLLLVEHDPHTIAIADYILDFGPGAGRLGGTVTAAGSYKEIIKNPRSLTGQYLCGKKTLPLIKKENLKQKEWIEVKKASLHNLKNISAKFPLGALSAITGVSGSGKSTLLHDVLAASFVDPETEHYSVQGLHNVARLAVVDQNPIGQTNRADVASYTDMLIHLREFFAELPEARARGLQPKHFSANHPAGMCSNCSGHGHKFISMLFMPPVEVLCKECLGLRLKPLALTVQYKGKNLGEVLKLTVDEASDFFVLPKLQKKLKLLQDVGLGYLQLGQEIATLSGGEAQRIKLCKELFSRAKNTLYLLDEPTNGLHMTDIALLLPVLKRLVENGHTVILIEHNKAVVEAADWVVELGPKAGKAGGRVIYEGPP